MQNAPKTPLINADKLERVSMMRTVHYTVAAVADSQLTVYVCLLMSTYVYVCLNNVTSCNPL